MEPVTAILAGAYIGTQIFGGIFSSRSNKKSLRIQREQLRLQREELERQKKIEIAQQKRENEQLMNSVSNLTNTSYSGVSSPSIDYDKYGDLG